MSSSKLIELTYYDPKREIRLTAYADTLILDSSGREKILSAVRFGGYPEMVRAMSDAIYGGAAIEAVRGETRLTLKSRLKGYRRQLSHDGVYAAATLMASDDMQTDDDPEEISATEKAKEQADQQKQPRKCYIFCPAGDRDRLFEELDRKTAAPLIPEFRDCVLDTLIDRGDLRPLEVYSIQERLDAWVLDLLPEDRNVVEILERSLENGSIAIPGGDPGQPDDFENVENVTGYLNAFGITVADRIRNQFRPLFDPASEPLSEEVLAVNDCIRAKAGYSLYGAQLAVAEAVKRQLEHKGAALIIAECGSGKSKIGTTALGALYGMRASRRGQEKTFNVVMSPSHVTRKWVREISETLPDVYAAVVRSIGDLNRLYAMYETGDRSVYAVLSKEKARDGCMRYPAVTWNRRKKAFLCPDCMEPLVMEISEDGSRYLVNADQFFFQTEHRRNHKCPRCGAVLWAPAAPERKLPWVRIGGYGWVYREKAAAHLGRTKTPAVLDQLQRIAEDPKGCYPVRGACRRYPLSTYIKKKLRGRISGFLADELHEYNNASGQGDAMAEIYGASKQFVGMTATLINGYSSGIFHLLYRIVPGLMQKDGKAYRRPSDFDAEYGVVENTYETAEGTYNSNRRTTKRKTRSRKLPGVSPLVFSRFLLEYTAFLSLSDMGKDLPDYEEIPVSLAMPPKVESAYRKAENILQAVLRRDRKAANKLLSAYLNLLTVYPDQPYDQPDILDPFSEGRTVLVHPENTADFGTVLPKEEKTLEIVRRKIAAGERVLIYTSWTRTDSQQKLQGLLTREGVRTEILSPQIPPDKREAWVEKRVNAGLQVLITNPKCVETGLDLNAFTTLVFYSMGYNLFTLRQASRRSWRINQTAPRVEVYLLYYKDTMQAKAMKLMASKLAVAGIIEGSFSEEGLAAMSDVKDMTSQMAKELALGIKDSVEDIAAAFKKMAVINPARGQAVPESSNRILGLPASAETEESPETAETPVEPDTRSADLQEQQALCGDLPPKPMEEQKKRKPRKQKPKRQKSKKRKPKKRTEVENQLSLFGSAA